MEILEEVLRDARFNVNDALDNECLNLAKSYAMDMQIMLDNYAGMLSNESFEFWNSEYEKLMWRIDNEGN